MLTPGEINRGQWVMIHSNVVNELPDMEENPLVGLLFRQPPPPSVPHIVTAVKLPFVVVVDCGTEPKPTSYIWRTDEKNLIEVSESFVEAYNVKALEIGKQLIQHYQNSEIKA